MDEPADEAYNGALAIVLDCGAAALIFDERYTLAEKTARIDHHVFCEKVADAEVSDTSFESCCGMIAAMAMECGWSVGADAAKALYTGMVTDSGRFRYSSTSPETLRLAAIMLEQGIDTDKLYANLYLDEFSELKFKSHIYKSMKITENGVAYIFVDKEMQEKFNLTLEQASACVGNLDSIRGVISWIAFIETGDENGAIRVRLRSRFVHINSIAEKYHGGGHACASGATVYSQEELQALLADTDALVKEYKETHEGWL